MMKILESNCYDGIIGWIHAFELIALQPIILSLSRMNSEQIVNKMCTVCIVYKNRSPDCITTHYPVWNLSGNTPFIVGANVCLA